MDLMSWALPQLSRLLDLDEDSIKQIVTHTASLPKHKAAEELQNLLGDTPQALEFIASFSNRLGGATPKPSAASNQRSEPSNSPSEVHKPKQRKKKVGGLGKLPEPRRPDNYGDTSGGYVKKDEKDYVAGSSKSRKANALALQEKPDALRIPIEQPSSTSTSPIPNPKPPPSAAGPLISDVIPSRKTSRNASPAPKAKTKINISGGTSMHGASSTINDLESAIRALEIQTNPSLSSSQDNSKRRCNCMATRHPLLEAAPNCLNCGKIICVKEGLGPCTFCSCPLLSAGEIQLMIRILREERGKEKMAANNASQKRAEVSKTPRPFTSQSTPLSSAPTSDSETEKLAAAKQHRDKLLAFQAQNAQRTRVHDEAADFETPTAGQSMWASPQERALQLKRQQKVLREQEWNARPEYEKRTVVASIDLVGGKVVRRMAAVERPKTPESEDESFEGRPQDTGRPKTGSGAFSRNPLLGSMIRPVAKIDPKGKAAEREKKQTWRRVQDENDDNEQWILDGGVYGGRKDGFETIGGLEDDGCG
ncbi:zf-C2HC5-domain-containing protein [Glonium stellatum]|uniref:Zf-C2HC5-domain-containing protein n=1 Tax=Glonium stellatum TaxID=574774 RepID=A0A8E2JTD6_9PEZI|nr:zf-C2HC5-domain-containing protein [Glonium stellatum]